MAYLKLPCNPRRRNKKGDCRTLNPLVGCPTRRLRCPYACLPGQCLNGQCAARMHGQVVHRKPGIEEEARVQQKQLTEAIERQKKADRETVMEEERRLMGMARPGGSDESMEPHKPSLNFLNLLKRKEPPKSMRSPARALCQLEVPDYSPPTGDYAELSRFLRLSTMPGHSSGDHVSEYNGSHNMGVWDGQKDLDRQAFKMKRDWLSVWGEFNVKEQRWRKAWVEKFGAEKST